MFAVPAQHKLVRFPLVSLGLTTILAVILVVAGCDGGDRPAVAGGVSIALDLEDIGLLQPAAVVVDTVADVYLVSNVNGVEGVVDGNGFISRISPEGEVLDVYWISSVNTAVALNSPRGMAIRGDSLIVADGECLRIFHRVTGADEGYNCLDGIGYITDVDFGPDGSVFITDGGYQGTDDGLVPSGSDAVYRIILSDESRGSTLARSDDLGNPSAIAVGRRGIFVATETTGEIFSLTPSGERSNVFSPSERRVRGITFLPDGGFVFSSWGDSALYGVSDAGQVSRLVEGLDEPGSPGYDPARNRLIVPLFGENRLVFIDLP
jgi:hypothetical protein